MVKVDDVDPNGKVSLSPAGEIEIPEGAVSSSRDSGRGRDRDRGDRGDRGERAERSDDDSADSGNRQYVSFEDTFADEAKAEFGDLGPEREESRSGGGGRDGGQRRRRRR
jgi:hypothetical protein